MTALAYTSSVAGYNTKSYKITEHYNSTNFFDKFEFFVVRDHCSGWSMVDWTRLTNV